ncbi:MAG: hypothetical protein KGQ59_11830, partial [Bdellovibrionales bacterium]|nr:hypothetical protein [Bdellovibrionales bacterium]
MNDNPTDISLDSAAVNLTAPVSTSVGRLSTADPDTVDRFTYTLVAGVGDSDNSSFIITGNHLLVGSQVYSQCRQGPYSIRVRSSDSGGLFIEKVFAI